MDYGYSSYTASNYARNLDATEALASSQVSDVILTALAGILGLIMFVVVAITILQIIGMWKTFLKAGEKGWKSLIPFYNIAILYKISGMSPYLVLVYIGLFIPGINFLASIAITIFSLYQKINLMKAFKASTGLTVSMLIVPFITYLILGFGKSEYVGFDEKSTATFEA